MKDFLALALGGAKKAAADDESDAPDSEGSEESPEKSCAREVYTALQDKDEDGFVEALLALKSCGAGKKKAPMPMAPEDDDEE